MNNIIAKTVESDRRSFMKMIGSAVLGFGFGSSGCTDKSYTGVRNNAPLAQDYTKIYHNPDPRVYVEGCGIARMPDGTLVAVVPVVVRHATLTEVGSRGIIPSITHIVRSTDGGQSWQEVSQLPYYSAAPWIHNGTLYLFAMKEGTRYRNDDLFLLYSDDDGRTWSDPATLFRGHFWNAHTSMVMRDNRVYWAFCDIPSRLQYGPPQRRPRVIAGDLSMDPMDPRSWRLSDPVDFPVVPKELIYPMSDPRSHALEANVIEVDGKIRLVSTVKPRGRDSDERFHITTNLSAVFDVDDNGEQLDVKFIQYHPRPGGHLKSFTIWDEETQMFWLVANLERSRRFLMLFYGLDGLNWVQACCVAQARKSHQSFHYPSMIIDNDDLAIISRSNIDGPNQHDADHATFHRIRNFRQLALDLIQEP